MEDIVQEILEGQTTAVMLLDEHLRVLYMNPAAESLLDVSGRQSAGHPIRDLVVQADAMLAKMQAALDTGQPFTQREAPLQLPDRVVQHVDYTITALAKPRSVLLELSPLNRLQRINRDDQSVNQQETSRKLIRGMAHEVKNPLGGIRGAAQLLERELAQLANPGALTEYTSVIIAETDRLTALVDRMLGPSSRPEKTSVNVHKVCERVLQLIDAENPGELTFRRDYDTSIPPLHADEDQLIQAVLNIASNAVTALRQTSQATLTLRTRVVRQFTIGQVLHRLVVQLDVIDNGPGIPEDIVDRVFFPMISGRPDGTGLGLAITQSIVAQHGGVLELESRPGYTCFSCFLPIEQSNPLDAPAPGAAEGASATGAQGTEEPNLE